MITKDMWKALDNIVPVKTPKTYLQEQATLLGEKTKGTLRGVVRSFPTEDDRFMHELIVIAPALNSYEYTILSIEHGIKLYPLVLHDATKLVKLKCTTEQGFLMRLQVVLSTPELREVLKSLISQSS